LLTYHGAPLRLEPVGGGWEGMKEALEAHRCFVWWWEPGDCTRYHMMAIREHHGGLVVLRRIGYDWVAVEVEGSWGVDEYAKVLAGGNQWSELLFTAWLEELCKKIS